MTVLITGASGLIGSELKEKLLKRGEEVYCQSRVNKEHDTRVKWIELDFNNPKFESLSLPEFSTVYHLASQTSLALAQQNPLSDHNINVSGFISLLMSLASQRNKANVIFAGTATQVGLPNVEIITEAVNDEPVTFYDTSKFCAENYLKQFVREGWLRGCSLRLANVFGSVNSSQNADRGIIDKVFRRALNGEEIFYYGNGQYFRDYIHLSDVISAFLSAADNVESLNGGHFIVASGKSLTLKEAFQTTIQIAKDISGKESALHSTPLPESISAIELRSVKYDNELFKKNTGWNSKFNLEEGLRFSYQRMVNR